MGALEYLLFCMKSIRQMLEGFIIPGLGISYWQFAVTILIMAIIMTVLLNYVRVTADGGIAQSERRTREAAYNKRESDRNADRRAMAAVRYKRLERTRSSGKEADSMERAHLKGKWKF